MHLLFQGVEVEGGLNPLKEKVGNGQVGQIKREPTVELNLPRLQNNQSCDKQHKGKILLLQSLSSLLTIVFPRSSSEARAYDDCKDGSRMQLIIVLFSFSIFL